ncbi:MAG: tRNA (adenosine(37)-N6)-dimethylallyltransferase MiaA [Candidatus Rokuibacteriota bacterium]|nr:MAG: tRNA (adenosine(37)-N6)-dimethylallyltransferase MiaA [Candidatus Rokubacteria bacterium]
MGPTGVGKTAVALELGRVLPIEIVSVDSRQVYRRMDVGTGKPSVEERRRVPHHVMDVVDPDEPYHVARFVREAEHAIGQIRGRGRWPVLVGGTGLYYRALVRGLAPRPPADPALRERLRHEAAAGPAALHRYLGEVDPAAAARLAANDVVRVTRALEVALREDRARVIPPGRSGSPWSARPCTPGSTGASRGCSPRGCSPRSARSSTPASRSICPRCRGSATGTWRRSWRVGPAWERRWPR